VVARITLLIAGVIVITMLSAAQALVRDDERIAEAMSKAEFFIQPRANYEGAQWIYDQDTNEIIGYAPWDSLKRRWTLFDLHGKYHGFIQATIGSTNPPHYTQYLWYGPENNYKGVFIAQLGGRPTSEKLPQGELGGGLVVYEKGNIPPVMPELKLEIDPSKTWPEGVEPDPVWRLRQK
jgi:hypothetical protein